MFLFHRYEIGEGLYIGWSSAVLAICGGACLMCACKVKTPNEKMWVSVDKTFDIVLLRIRALVLILIFVFCGLGHIHTSHPPEDTYCQLWQRLSLHQATMEEMRTSDCGKLSWSQLAFWMHYGSIYKFLITV